MNRIKIAFWAALALLSLLWLAADPGALQPAGFFALRSGMVQWSGILAMGCMSLAMVLALRLRWPEQALGGLDKTYRLHKWLGIGGLCLSVAHWLWTQAPKWAVGLGWLQRPARGPRGPVGNAIEQFLGSLRDPAEGLGEWAFYASVLLIAVALIRLVPYHVFYKTHRLLAVAYLVLVFHSAVLTQFGYWATPLGGLLAVLLAAGSVAAVVSLFGRIGAGRKVRGSIASLTYYPPLRVLEGEIDIPEGWPGHKAGQFAFVRSQPSEGAHPYTIASAWHPAVHRLTFVVKALGDHTARLRDSLRVGQSIEIEGPYGGFTFDDDCRHQIWVGGGIGITPFIARMKQRALQRRTEPGAPAVQTVDLFHTTADFSAEAITKLEADARAADVRLHVLVDSRHGRLNGERIRAEVPGWRDASLWFCGPSGFGVALSRDFAAHGFPVGTHFHQELFALR
ncbi:ferredoxin reductase family protein [Dongia sedimenti]|uniref:Ferric reductase-like transmembrane domain-containing protein n=1 Tax=Dongia sedimenti TaxID=3064282 RepID=A0ABU0YGE1_9PROT|nr:ferric reductase-like transmembrane domain-containing protein [Rhodospirillaceae bacterium R-7]